MTDSAAVAKREVTPKSAQLPSSTPKTTHRVVDALAALAGPASPERIASRLKVQLKGRLISDIVSGKLYGFIAVDEDGKLIMTERGTAFLSDDSETSMQAGRDGLMSTGFASIVRKLITHKADPEVVAVRFEEDQGLSPGPAKTRASTLIKAAKETRLITDGKFDAAAVEDTISRVGDITVARAKPSGQPTASPSQASSHQTAKSEKPKADKPRPTTAKDKKSERQTLSSEETADVPFGRASMQVVLQIDASKLKAEEIIDIARQLKEVAAPSMISS